MDASEYLAFVPLLFYGIALADLLGQWRRFFDKKYFYWRYFLTTIMLTEVAVWNVFLYFDVVQHLEGISYLSYWRYLVQPMIFLVMVSALTPEGDDRDTESFFKERMPVVFGLFAIYISCHFLPSFGVVVEIDFARVAGILICALIAVTRKGWLVDLLVVVWLAGILLRTESLSPVEF